MEGDSGSTSNFFYKLFICNMILQLFTTSKIIKAVIPVEQFCFHGQLWEEVPSIKDFSWPFNTTILVSFSAFFIV